MAETPQEERICFDSARTPHICSTKWVDSKVEVEGEDTGFARIQCLQRVLCRNFGLINLEELDKNYEKDMYLAFGQAETIWQVKLVWYYNNALGRPNKKKIIARQKAYHGSTIVAASLTGLTNLHQGFDLPIPFVLHTDCPHYWRFRNAGESEEEFATRLANNLEQLILKEGADNIAAFIAEPVIGAGGVIPPPAMYFDKVQAVLKKHDILFIADEVICAFGRLGTMFGCEKYNIKPDLVTVAKVGLEKEMANEKVEVWACDILEVYENEMST
ncbi:hypothetical protein L7F22_000951 [Adiantum nelumboides]|nr:hypothetical protein [Adiantum nelumboides]